MIPRDDDDEEPGPDRDRNRRRNGDDDRGVRRRPGLIRRTAGRALRAAARAADRRRSRRNR